MIAAARIVRQVRGPDVDLVFIGPCIAKKGEAESEEVKGEISAVLTFAELRQIAATAGVLPGAVEPSDFDPPWSGSGGLFPISRGLLQAADINEDLMDCEVIATDGRTNFVEAIEDVADGSLDVRLLEVLCCNGCIMGAGMTTRSPLFRRRSLVGQYVRQHRTRGRKEQWRLDLARFSGVDLGRSFKACELRVPQASRDEITAILARMGKVKPEDELKCGACGYDSCVQHAVAIHRHLAETEM
jgi:iron only hydrogenase large subunit-like protein